MPISDTRQQDLLALTPLIRRVVAARVRDPQVVDDLVQETFARLLQAGPRLDDGALAPFAVVLARNVAVSFVRGRFTRPATATAWWSSPSRTGPRSGRCVRRRPARLPRDTLLLMDIAFLPFAASVLAAAFRTGHGQRTAVVFHGMTFLLAAILFNVIWGYVRRDQRLLGTTIDSVGVRAVSRRFRLALAWIGTGTLLGALLPVLGMAVIAAFIPYYWLPIRGETAKPRRDRGGDQA